MRAIRKLAKCIDKNSDWFSNHSNLSKIRLEVRNQVTESGRHHILEIIAPSIVKTTPRTTLYSKPIPKERLETFIDGIFAVALTLLIVNVVEGIPDVKESWHESEKIAQEWSKLWHKTLVFIYTFWVVGIFWISNHNELNMLVKLGGIKDTGERTKMREFLHANLLFLLFIVFVPFSSAFLGNNIEASRQIAKTNFDYGFLVSAMCSSKFMHDLINRMEWSQCLSLSDGFWRMRLPFLVYAANLVLTSLSLQWVWSYIKKGDAGQFDVDHRPEVVGTTRRNRFIPLWIMILALLGILGPVFYVQFLLVLVPLVYTVRMLHQAATRPGFDALRAKWRWIFALGIIYVVAGLIGLGSVVVATVVSVFVVGIMMLIAGVAEVVNAFQVKSWESFCPGSFSERCTSLLAL